MGDLAHRIESCRSRREGSSYPKQEPYQVCVCVWFSPFQWSCWCIECRRNVWLVVVTSPVQMWSEKTHTMTQRQDGKECCSTDCRRNGEKRAHHRVFVAWISCCQHDPSCFRFSPRIFCGSTPSLNMDGVGSWHVLLFCCACTAPDPNSTQHNFTPPPASSSLHRLNNGDVTLLLYIGIAASSFAKPLRFTESSWPSSSRTK